MTPRHGSGSTRRFLCAAMLVAAGGCAAAPTTRGQPEPAAAPSGPPVVEVTEPRTFSVGPPVARSTFDVRPLPPELRLKAAPADVFTGSLSDRFLTAPTTVYHGEFVTSGEAPVPALVVISGPLPGCPSPRPSPPPVTPGGPPVGVSQEWCYQAIVRSDTTG